MHFVRDILKLSYVVATKHFKMDVSCEASVNFHHVSHKATPATDHAIRKNTQHDTSKVLCLPRKMNMEVSQSGAPATKNASHLRKAMQQYCACHTDWLLTIIQSMLECHNVPCFHTKRCCATFQTTFSAVAIGMAIAQSSRTVTDACGRQSSDEQTRLSPRPPK